MTLLALNQVSRRFQDGARVLTVLDHVCLQLDPGELVGVYGQRRAGKSTLLRLAAGLEQPDEGTVAFDGAALGSISHSARARLRRRGGLALASGDSRALG
ncbi:MAG: ATP-binding cassette domain-containing protein, partial [Acidimicrobiales bacterium]